MKPMASLAALQAMLVFLLPCSAADLAGQASVIDGDTIEIHGQRIKILGIDAPESGQSCKDRKGKVWRCGQVAAFQLAYYIGRSVVTCYDRGTDRYGRLIARCHSGDRDLSSMLVSSGLAVAYRRYSMDYVDDEEAARDNGDFLWSGEFVMPWD
jgi:endonuclease YncB( thermonuclease family)